MGKYIGHPMVPMRPMMDLEELRVVRRGGRDGLDRGCFARSLNYARATLRRRLDELETRAGVPLLNRTAQGVDADRGR